jgi:hypothetical protein
VRENLHELRSPAETVQAAGLDELLDRSLAHGLGVDAFAEVEEVRKPSALGADADDLLGGAAAEALDGGHSEEDTTAHDVKSGWLALTSGGNTSAAGGVRRQYAAP